MFTLAATSTALQEIKRSRFVATAGAVPDEQAARDFVAAHASKEANHNCWAWRIGQSYRFNDDGEPSGTAGKPILQAIDGQELDQVAVVVTRVFGGILLGSGGLMRAYGGTAALCLRDAAKIRMVATVGVGIEVSFSDLALVKARLLALPDVHLSQEHFTATGAALAFTVPVDDAQQIGQLAIDLTRGQVVVKHGV